MKQEMKIACLGWGSLVWRPEFLLIYRQWFNDGPILPIEFARQSNDGRLTLVIMPSAKPVRSLWALMTTNDIEQAKNSLMIREGIAKENQDRLIGAVNVSVRLEEPNELVIQNWAKLLALDWVIWTNLAPRFNGENKAPSPEEATEYLRGLDTKRRGIAEEYIRRTPRQIDTEYRRRFEHEFGWTYID